MSPLIAVFFAIVGAVCFALSGYYASFCFAADFHVINKLALESDDLKCTYNCQHGKGLVYGFGAGGLVASAAAMYIVWPKSS